MRYEMTRTEVLDALAVIIQAVARDATDEDKCNGSLEALDLGDVLGDCSDEEKPASAYDVTDLLYDLKTKIGGTNDG